MVESTVKLLFGCWDEVVQYTTIWSRGESFLGLILLLFKFNIVYKEICVRKMAICLVCLLEKMNAWLVSGMIYTDMFCVLFDRIYQAK